MRKPFFKTALVVPPFLLTILKDVAIGLAQEAVKQFIAYRNRKK